MSLQTDIVALLERGRACAVEIGSEILEVRGKDGLDLLQRISTNDLSATGKGSWTQTILTNEKGRMIDVIWVGKSQENVLFVVSAVAGAEKVMRWIEKFVIMEEIEIHLVNDRFTHILLFGSAEGFPKTEYIAFEEQGNRVGLRHCLVKKGDTTGFVDSLKTNGVALASRADLEEFRIKSGSPLSPHEVNEDVNPLEAGLSGLISWTKGCYVGQEVIARLDTYKKVQKKLVRLVASARPSHLPAPIRNSKGGECGKLTSVTMSAPFMALGYVLSGQMRGGEKLSVQDDGNNIELSFVE